MSLLYRYAIAAGLGAALIVLIFMAGVHHERNRQAQAIVKQLQKDSAVATRIEEEADEKEERTAEAVKHVVESQAEWARRPLPADAVRGLCDAGLLRQGC